MTLIKLVICCSLTLGLATVCSAKEWRGIVPLESTRADVERLLGVPKQKSSLAHYYRFHDELAVVWFQSQPCDQCWGWHVPVETVTTLGVIPLSARAPEPAVIEGFKSDTNGGFVYYTNEVDGLTVETHNGKVTSVEYGPEKRLDDLRCVPKDCFAHPSRSFDEYSLVRWEDEKARLNNFGIRLKEETGGRGVIVVSGPTEAERAKLLKHAVRARRHLETLGLEPQRILIADGGYREISLFALSAYTIGGFRYRIYLWPEKDPPKTADQEGYKNETSVLVMREYLRHPVANQRSPT
jgi:hypothetical protein